MTIDLATLRSELRFALSMDSLDLPDPDADLLLNRTYWELLEKFHIRETESSMTFPTVAGTRQYSLPASFESLRISAIVDPDSLQHTQLDKFSIKQYENVYSDDEDQRNIPTNYFRGNEDIILWPTPDDVYTVVIHYKSTLADLSDANVDAALPKSWQELLLFGATYRGFIRFNDYDKARGAKSNYDSILITMVPQESKEEWDTSTAGLQPKGMRDYP